MLRCAAHHMGIEWVPPVRAGWIVELDFRRFFDSLDHGDYVGFFVSGFSTGVLLPLIGKWLKSGILSEGQAHRAIAGMPQGGVISPFLADDYLHRVVDLWWAERLSTRLDGRAHAIPHADDVVPAFYLEEDDWLVLKALPERVAGNGLCFHPEKTQLFEYRSQPSARGPAKWVSPQGVSTSAALHTSGACRAKEPG